MQCASVGGDTHVYKMNTGRVNTMIQASNFSYKQPAARMQRWVWVNIAAPLPAYPPRLSTTRAQVFFDTVDTFTKEMCSAWTRPLLTSPQRCFEPARRGTDGVAVPAVLTLRVQAYWIGSAITAAAVGLAACVVGITLGIVVGTVRAALAPPDASRAFEFHAHEQEKWAARSDALRGAFVRQMSHRHTDLPVVLKAAALERGADARGSVQVALQNLDAELQRLPDVVEPDDAGPFLAVVEDIVETLRLPGRGATCANVAHDAGAGSDQYVNAAHQHAAEILASLRELMDWHDDACREERRASLMLQSM